MKKFHLSVVATSRNDDHGVNLLYRMQNFVDGFIQQCKRHNLNAELILVEWNYIEGKETLDQVLKFPKDLGTCAIRIIRVPKKIHDTFANSDKIPLYQMIAKNVGIRRAHGEFVLATNIDILFSDELMLYFLDQLKKGKFYRVDRLDIPHFLPETNSFTELLKFCGKNYFRINGRFGTKIKINGKWRKEKNTIKRFRKINLICVLKNLRLLSYWKNNIKYFAHLAYNLAYKIQNRLNHYLRSLLKKTSQFLHTNACGDFTLLSYDDWMKLRAYPEWPIFSWHVDSIFLYQAKISGLKQHILTNKPIYHIEHSKGSGYTPGDSELLFKRLKENHIPYLSNSDVFNRVIEMKKMKKNREAIIYNDDKWGLADFDLEEVWV